jgi:DNA-binding response OmpR family regulator
MPLYSKKEILNLKLNSIKSKELRVLAENLGISTKGSAAEIIKRILEMKPQPSENIVDVYIKSIFRQSIQERKELISDDDLKNELSKVKSFSWGTKQGRNFFSSCG